MIGVGAADMSRRAIGDRQEFLNTRPCIALIDFGETLAESVTHHLGHALPGGA